MTHEGRSRIGADTRHTTAAVGVCCNERVFQHEKGVSACRKKMLTRNANVRESERALQINPAGVSRDAGRVKTKRKQTEYTQSAPRLALNIFRPFH